MSPNSPVVGHLSAAQTLAPSTISIPSSTMLTASCIVDSSWSLSTPDTWFFNHFLGVEECPTLGVGDAIAIYRHAPDGSFLPLPVPAFTCKLGRITGWSSSHVAFWVYRDLSAASLKPPFPPTILHLPSPVVRLSFLQRLWGIFFPFPQSFQMPERPTLDLSPAEDDASSSPAFSTGAHLHVSMEHQEPFPLDSHAPALLNHVGQHNSISTLGGELDSPDSVSQTCGIQLPADPCSMAALGSLDHCVSIRKNGYCIYG
ncbi:hypothetical protein K503DRAFT_806920 [Rhizopogon vinicolor AM-OR11-026]|uniref:Uncharacterized protein n=1 Tax=Rhizopogon vinicolor AM-OR11-026 TaxID=1314800 RepID=A0A1B7MDH9_9AGAM|nr:hypothetical protein K503DRAFT_806920 [Rhizopogon vinicolor AM-OR11-026]